MVNPWFSNMVLGFYIPHITHKLSDLSGMIFVGKAKLQLPNHGGFTGSSPFFLPVGTNNQNGGHAPSGSTILAVQMEAR